MGAHYEVEEVQSGYTIKESSSPSSFIEIKVPLSEIEEWFDKQFSKVKDEGSDFLWISLGRDVLNSDKSRRRFNFDFGESDNHEFTLGVVEYDEDGKSFSFVTSGQAVFLRKFKKQQENYILQYLSKDDLSFDDVDYLFEGAWGGKEDLFSWREDE